MKRVFIVHGWDGSPDANWLPWMKKELEARGFEVIVPAMPDTEHPRIDAWVSHLRTIVSVPNKDTYFIGHSIGAQAIVRYLQTIEQEVGGVLHVAGWFTVSGLETEEEKEIARPWAETPIRFDAVRAITPRSIAILSDDDPFVPLENAKLFREQLGAKVVIVHNQGHLTGEETGVVEFPIILETFLKLAT